MIIALEAVTKSFGAVRAVERVSFEVRRGEFFAILGPSGCGKTTLLRILAGFEDPDDGNVLIDGQPMAGVSPHTRPTNMVFQNYAIFPHLNVRDNIAYGLRRQKLGRQETDELVIKALELIKLTGYGGRAAQELSGGERQRVALARALVCRPKVLLLDEPLGALDKKLREETQIELVNIIEQVGVTCVMVTHDQEEAMTMASRIAVMSEGRVLQVGTPGEIYETPANRFVADFIGNVNLMDGTLIEDEADHVVVRCADCTHFVGHGITGSVGMAVSVALRPEKIALQRDEPAGLHNRARGTIRDLAYFGSYTVYHLQLASGALLKVSQANSTRHREDGLTWGDAVWAHWTPTSQVVLTQ